MNIYEKYKNLTSKVEKENKQRFDIKYSDEYISIQKEIAEKQEKLAEMLKVVPDSGIELLNLKNEIIEDMKKNKIVQKDGLKAKIKKKNKVNNLGVYHAFDGDTDMFLTVANITQANLKKFWSDNPEFKKPLQDCIEVESETIIDITID